MVLNGISNFNGGFLDLGIDPGLNFNPNKDSFTVSLWFKIYGTQGVLIRRGSIIPDIFPSWIKSPHTSAVKREGYDDFLGNILDNPDFEIWIDKGRLCAKIGRDGMVEEKSVTGKSNVSRNQWHLATLVNDSTLNNYQLYLDGVKQGAANTMPHKPSENRLILGGFETEDAFAKNKIMPYFSGQLDALKIYNRALSKAEINALLNQGCKNE